MRFSKLAAAAIVSFTCSFDSFELHPYKLMAMTPANKTLKPFFHTISPSFILYLKSHNSLTSSSLCDTKTTGFEI